MQVVSNTSPIIFLSKIDALDLLPQCFDNIFIPQAVVNELRNFSPPNYIERSSLSIAGSNFALGATTMWSLHIGELEAMVLAQEIQAECIFHQKY